MPDKDIYRILHCMKYMYTIIVGASESIVFVPYKSS